jgi:hypothetical protein
MNAWGRARRLLAIACALGSLLLAPAGARAATRLTFLCEFDVCQVGPDGKGLKRLTTNGKPRGYQLLAGALDGNTFAFALGGEWFVADGRVRHKRALPGGGGSLRGDGRAIVSTVGARLCVTELPSRRRRCRASVDHNWVAWGPGRSVLAVPVDRKTICVLGRGRRCVRVVGRTDHTFYGEPAISPDGRRIVIEENLYPYADVRRIVMFDVRSGRRVRLVTDKNPSDSWPRWSPDGRSIAFTRHGHIVGPVDNTQYIDGEVWTASLRTGRLRRVTRGVYATWHAG